MQKLGEIAEISTGFPFDGHKYTSIGIRVVRGENIGQGELHWEEKVDKRWNESTSALDNYWLYEGDIVMQMDGNVGKNIARIYTADPMLIAQRVACIRAKEKCSQDYIYGILRTKLFKNYIERCATGTSIKHISLQQISDFEFDFHLPEIQAKLGRIIADIDDKIRVNRQINDNLEAMAKQLYDYWFVQFDFPNEEGKPYKSSGGAMVWNEKLKREIPQGWSISNVKSLIEPIERGISYSSDDLLDPFATPMINLACFSKAGDYRLGEMKFFSGKVSNDKLISPMDMLIACTDMTQGADIIGRPILASDEYNQYTFSTDLALITPKGKFKMYLYYTLRTPFYHKYIRPFASGTTVKHLNLIGIENYGLPVPPIEIQSKFEDLITPIKEKQSKNLNEINALTKQRDELLPLLMNGQASVNYHLSAC